MSVGTRTGPLSVMVLLNAHVPLARTAVSSSSSSSRAFCHSLRSTRRVRLDRIANVSVRPARRVYSDC